MTIFVGITYVYMKVFIIGKDFGARPGYQFALLHPERVIGVITMGVPYLPPGPSTFQNYLPEGFYISRWQVFSYLLPFVIVTI